MDRGRGKGGGTDRGTDKDRGKGRGVAGACVFGLILLHLLVPLDFNALLQTRLAHL